MGQAPKITIVGSINMDIVTITDQLPKMGETILGQQFQMNPGGKGANQAVASARLGAAVQMIGCVGEDLFGNELIAHLNSEGVDVSNVEQVATQTGTASITVSNKDNNIIVVPGANNYVTASFVEAKRDVIATSDILILQLEIPLEGVQKAVEIAKDNGVIVILNPAPIRELPADLLNSVDYLTPNEHEIKHLTNEENHAELIEKVILTKGSEGVSYFQDGKEMNIPAYTIGVVDTTGAGDSFNAGFAVALGQGLSVEAACQYGNAVAALSTTKLGAQTGMPTAPEVQEFLISKN
ncbi:ribokinase [Sporosarcina luteola]|uniref:ribokinase n=1 Tax=Sporosarcina luteola TaxID=582850 RepID=UPI002041CC0E|nr:ribokinase [Sporosarcina luteola]MCM3711661.1 ribokinase [Sporosarcina luteola]